MKKTLFVFLFASFAAAQVQLGKNVQIGSGTSGTVTQVDTDSTSGITGGPITTTGTVACSQATASQFGCVKPDGTTITASGGVLTATGSGGSGVQYNPTTTSYIIASFSGLYDDGDANSRNIGVPTSVNCVHTTTSTCTVVFGSAHGLSVAGAVDMFNLSTWPYSQQAAQFGSFQVTTVPNSTTITFTTPTTLTYTCGPCTGNVYDASYWGIWHFAREPYIYGHGTVYGIETTSQNLATNFNTLTSGLVGTPTFLIDQTGQNDLVSGTSVATIEGYHQTIWAAAHTAGMTVAQTTMVPAQYGLSGGIDSKPGQINLWYWLNSRKTPSNVASGQYVDWYIDTASAMQQLPSFSAMPNPQANPYFGDTINAAFAAQKTIEAFPPVNITVQAMSNPVPGIKLGSRQLIYDDNWTQVADWNPGSGGSILYSVSNNPTMNYLNPSMTANSTWASDFIGIGGGNNNAIGRRFHYVSNNSTSNYLAYFTNGGNDIIRFIADGEVQFPNVATSASTAPACFNGALGGLTNVGCAGGSVAWGSITGTLSSQTDLQTALNAKAPTASPTFTGTPDASGSTQFKLPVAASFASAANGELGYDSTNLNWHVWSNAADQFMATFPVATPPTSGNCAEFSKVGNSWKLIDAGGPCGISGGGVTAFSGDGALLSNSASTGSVTATLANAAAHKFWGNNTGISATPGYQTVGPADMTAQAADTVVMNATGGNAAPSAVAMPTCTSGADLYNTSTHTWSCVSTGGGSGAWTNITGSSQITATGCTQSGSTGGNCAVSGTTTSVVTLSVIPGGHNGLVLKMYGLSNSGSPTGVNMQVNGDTGSNYAQEGWFQLGSAGSLSTFGTVSQTSCPMAYMTATGINNAVITIDGYADTSFVKMFDSSHNGSDSVSSVTNNAKESRNCMWNNTAAVTSISLTNPNNFKAGTKFILYAID